MENVVRSCLFQDVLHHLDAREFRRVEIQLVAYPLNVVDSAEDSAGEMPVGVGQQVLCQMTAHETVDPSDECPRSSHVFLQGSF